MKRFYRWQSWVVVLGAVLALPLISLAAKEFTMPKVEPAASYPAHDYHSKELVTVALDPYDTPAKANIFIVPYHNEGLLPILLVITNDSDQAITVSDMKAELVTADRVKLTPDTDDDVFRRVSHTRSSGTRVPIPFPTKKIKGGLNAKEWDEIETAQFNAKAVEPRSTQAGFLFFDISDISNPLRGAHFYLTSVHDSSGNDLMFFDVPLDKYANAQK
jgi:hypothetical protein